MATQAALAQYALNTAIALQGALLNGQAEPATKGDLMAVLGAIAVLAEAVINAGGGTIPNSMLTGKYSAVASTTAPIQT